MKATTYLERKTLLQFLRYAVVGLMNTLLTLIVIFVCKSMIGMNPWVSNAMGYLAGFINSFIWNKVWVFNSHNGLMREVVRFIIGFLLCYGLQLLVTWLITEHTPLHGIEINVVGFVFSGYGIATLLGMGFYTVANFVYNRMVTFK